MALNPLFIMKNQAQVLIANQEDDIAEEDKQQLEKIANYSPKLWSDQSWRLIDKLSKEESKDSIF